MSNIIPDTTSASSTLDSLYGTAGQALSLWSQWTDKKTANTAAKAAIPSAVLTPGMDSGLGGISTKTWTMIGVAVAVLGLLAVFLRRGK